ncbi:MAG: hypothetical protein Q4F39_01265 [Bacteroidia bacterium]|nr:hypothetical protein [Bacteroidia bacterium]
MLVYFEGHRYPQDLVVPYFTDRDFNEPVVPYMHDRNGYYLEYIGYIFATSEKYSGPVFILPKSFLAVDETDPDKRETLLGEPGLLPELIFDTDKDDNVLALSGRETFLPELSLWLFRAMVRFREDCKKEKDQENLDKLYQLTPQDNSRDRDFLSTAIRLIDFLSDHRNLFTQIHKINNSGRAAIDWNKTIRKYPYIKESKPYYLDLQIKDKAINIDEELIILYYSVLRYLKDKFHFPITLGDIPYELLSPSEIQRYLDTGVGKRKMRDIKGKYFRDDLRTLWNLLDAFFTFNYSRDDKCPRKEALAVKEFDAVFEKMVDRLIGDTGKLAALKNQKDGKLIDHIYMDKSLIGKDSNIYYIGDSKYYSDSHDIEGVPLYKQFTYARNAIQYNIDQYYLKHKANPNAIRYRDKDTEGYNVTPNFFVRPKIKSDTLDFDTPSFSASGNQPKPNKHFEDRLFDRDTLLLREYEINLIFLIAAYGSYETSWTNTLRQTIREDMLQFLTDTYTFFKIQPMDIPMYSQTGLVGTIPFVRYFHSILAGKAYKEQDDANEIYLAFERTPQGERDSAEVLDEIKYAVEDQAALSHPIKLKQ